MNIWNTHKLWTRILSLILSVTLVVSLVTGCQQRASQTINNSVTDNPVQATDEGSSVDSLLEEIGDTETIPAQNANMGILTEEQVQELHAREQELSKAAENEQNTLDHFVASLADGDLAEAEAAFSSLRSDIQMADRTMEAWFSTNQDVTEIIAPQLSETAAGQLQERERTLYQSITGQQKAVQNSLENIEHAFVNDDSAAVEKSVSDLKAVLGRTAKTQTYGAGQSVSTVTESSVSIESTEESAYSEELMELADELETPLEVYNYLKNTIQYEYYYGSRKGANVTLATYGGNDYDQASLLIAMLRYLGYEAEYVRGNITLTEEQACSLTGADNYEHAADILASAGVPVVKIMDQGTIASLQMEHVWVRAELPYTEYRGAGAAGGDLVWLDLDTGIKAYEEVESICDVAEDNGLPDGLLKSIESGDEEQIRSLLQEYQSDLKAQYPNGLYARRRMIKQTCLTYLPASLQYEVEKELAIFQKIGNSYSDSISFQVAGEVMGNYPASELAGSDILLIFLPAEQSDAEILAAYDTIFDVPAAYVHVKPALMVNGEIQAITEDIEMTLGEACEFQMTLNHAGNAAGKTKVICNTVTAGSMYAVTLDTQTISGEELRSSYYQVTALKDSVTDMNVYSPEYLGRFLSLAGKLYFSELDIYDTLSADIYQVANTRKLSAGITGYEVQKVSRYGIITGLSEGSLYIDIDADDHSVMSLTGEQQAAKAYLLSTGLVGSYYESIVWEQLTGYESVSTVSILKKARGEGIKILQIDQDNLETELGKLHTDNNTLQEIRTAVQNGKLVTIPAEQVQIGNWIGTGYIVTDPETGAGAYMISGGLNGGAVSDVLTTEVLASTIMAILGTYYLISSVAAVGLYMMAPYACMIATVLLVTLISYLVFEMYTSYYEYLDTGELDDYVDTEDKAGILMLIGSMETMSAESLLAYKMANAGNGGVEESESGSEYLKQLDNMNETKINHIINGSKKSNHNWELLVPDKNWNDIKSIINVVMETGNEGSYKSVFSRIANINGYSVEVTYTKLSDGTIKISDAWVMEGN